MISQKLSIDGFPGGVGGVTPPILSYQLTNSLIFLHLSVNFKIIFVFIVVRLFFSSQGLRFLHQKANF